jgi:putative transposase
VEERREIVCKYVSCGLPVKKAVLISGISKSSYYYRSVGLRKGKPPSTYTIRMGTRVGNHDVIKRIEAIISEDDFIDYGYQRAHRMLRKEGYIINHKKVYRLMKEHKLLYPAAKAGQQIRRNFVKYTTPAYIHPFATVEVDIKYVFIDGARRHAYLLTLLDTFTRMAVDWTIGYQMTNEMISPLVKRYVNNQLVAPYANTSRLKLRSDNGPQFISGKFADKLQPLPIDQEFIQPGTPQQNGHIESFHNTVRRLVIDKYSFDDLSHARKIFQRFYQTYNEKRIMKSILYCTPIEFLRIWEEGKVGIEVRNQKQKFFFRERQSLG